MRFIVTSFVVASLAVGSFAASEKEVLEMGKSIYEETCQSCHGEDGGGNEEARFIVRPRALSKSILREDQSYAIIEKGAHYWGASADIMPSFASTHSPEELHAVAHYIAKHFNPDVDKRINELYAQSKPIPQKKQSKMQKRGAKIYKRNCSWCHGIEGRGDGEATRNPELSIFPYDLTKTLLDSKQIFLYIKYGGHYWGTYKNDMPNWAPKYDDFTLKSVTQYVVEHIKKGE